MLTRVKKLLRRYIPDSSYYAAKRAKDRIDYKARSDSYEPLFSYAIVSPMYNVAPYLNDFLESVVGQSVKRNRLQLILVDDGSTDGSTEIAQEWRARYPELIQYLRKENGGLPSARNAGMPLVKSDWVTFADPDDFLPADYFEKIDKTIAEHDDLMLFCVREVFYNEETNEIVDGHPLNDRFSKGNRFYRYNDEEHLPIIESANRSFYRADEIRRQSLTADERVKPSFEDGHFTNRYLLQLSGGSVGFLRSPIYYYRKRRAADSLLDTSWTKPEKVINQTRYGYLDLLDFSKRIKGYVPHNIQTTVLYDLSWYFRRYVDHPELSAFLSSEEVDEAYETMGRISEYLDQDVVFGKHSNRMGFEHKNALVRGFKQELPVKQRVYLRRADPESKILHFVLYSGDVRLSLSGVQKEPIETKATAHTYLGKELYRSFEVFLSYDEPDEELRFAFDYGAEVEIDVWGKVFPNGSTVGDLVNYHPEGWSQYMPQDDVWIVMDRDTQADDNGEHFYRYLKQNHPNQKAYFALRKGSDDWARLEKEGFNLLDFGSAEYERVLKTCSTIVSSHLDDYVTSYFRDRFFFSKDIICLQHGVLRSNLSSWFNTKSEVNLFITSTQFEYDSVVKDGTTYIQTARDVALTGLPRHDFLLKKAEKAEKGERMVLVMPTWRKGLMGAPKGNGNERLINPNFGHSEFRLRWEEFLFSDVVKRLVDDDVRVVFYPHANISEYVDAGLFCVPPYVEYGHNGDGQSIQDYLARASLFITDYSSASFDAAYAGASCIYYQFDQEEYYSTGHHSGRGYFDDERDGFGPVATNEKDLERALLALWEQDFAIGSLYGQRVKETFKYRDGHCCDRVYDAIVSLHDPVCAEQQRLPLPPGGVVEKQ